MFLLDAKYATIFERYSMTRFMRVDIHLQFFYIP
jgi:hypothetical protein